MKKALAMMLTVVMTLSLAACGGGNQTPAPAASSQPAPSQAAPAPADDNAGNTSEDYAEDEYEDYDDPESEAYVEAMSEYIASIDELMGDALPALLDATELIETEEDLQDWCVAFIDLKDTVGQAADSLADVAGDVPADYQESHAKITIATAAIYDAMTGFENAVDASINGDEDAFTDGLAAFFGNIMAAEELWNEAVE